MSALQPALAALAAGNRPNPDDLGAAFAAIMDGEAPHGDIMAFLRGMNAHMHDAEAISIGVSALRQRMVPVTAPADAIDVCGTGGDGAHTLNISTAVALVVAGCDVAVAKHGNRAMSSRTGAADVLEALGVKLTADRATLEKCLREAGLAFLFAQNHHPAMRHVAAARREIQGRTVFNLFGPLSNPAGVSRQLVGVFAGDLARPLAQALIRLGSAQAMVVHGYGGLDELSGEGDNLAITAEASGLQTISINAADAGLAAAANATLTGADAAYNAAALRALLDDRFPNPAYANVVALNAAAALLIAGRAANLREGAAMAHESLKSGAARARLDRLIALTQEAP
jgi:anthranilate phosphoribosyltransferase